MNNIAIIQQGAGRYLFSLPNDVTLKEGDRVKCSTRRGITDGIAFTDSAWVDENVSQLIGKLTGAKFPLKSVVGRLEYLPFEKPEANPANKYEGMSNKQLDREMCSRAPSCHARNDGSRKHDCLFADDFGSCDVNDANRADVIKYLLAEDAESAPNPQDNPANKYEGMSNKQLDREMCGRGACRARYCERRKHDCLFADDFGCDVTDANRAEVIKYLLAEDAEAALKPEDKQEPVKLYCVKDYITPFGNVELIKGTVCTFNPAVGVLELPDGRRVGDATEPRSYDDWKTENPCRAACLVPLVKRPAEVGEYVLLDNDDCFCKNKKGDIANVVETPSQTTTFCFIGDPTLKYSGGICVCFGSDYTYVLDGYKPTPEAGPEPEYFSGKVVCVSSGDECFTVGKMYEFINGEIKDDDGDARPMHADERFKSVEEWNNAYGMPIARFIEFKGEAHD